MFPIFFTFYICYNGFGDVMKKICIIVLTLLMLTGCQKAKIEEENDAQLYRQYQQYNNKVKNGEHYETQISECSVKLIINQTNNDHIRYDIIIDQPQKTMKNIKAIAYVENENKYTPPSIGLLENDSFTLKPNVTDKEHGIYKGINLSGITSLQNITVKVYLTYKNKNKTIERYIILYENASG